HVGQSDLDTLELDERFAELLPLLDIGDGAVECLLADAEAHGGVAEPLDGEDSEQLAKTAGGDDQVLLGDPDFVEDDVSGGNAAEAHEPFGGTEAEAGGAFLDDEGADPLGAGFVGEAGVDEVEVG